MQTSFGEVAYFSLGVWPPKPENENKKLQEWNSPKQALYVVQWKKTRKWKKKMKKWDRPKQALYVVQWKSR